MAKCFTSNLSWLLILLLVLLQTQTGIGSTATVPKSGVTKLRVGVPQKDGFNEFVNVVCDSSEQNCKPSGKQWFRNIRCTSPSDPIKGSSEVQMVVAVRYGRQQTMWKFVKPFSWDLWLSIIIISTFIGACILIMERNNIDALPNHEGSSNRTKLSAATILWFPISQAILPEKQMVVKNCSRFVLMIWLVLAFVLMQSYTANLTSILTLDQLRPSVLNLNDLRKEGHYVGYQAGSFVYGVLVEKFRFDPSNLKPYSSASEYHHALKLGSQHGGVAAVFDELPYLKVFLQQYGSDYILAGPTYRNDGFGFALKMNSNLTAYFSRAILQVTGSDLMNDIEGKYFGKNEIGAEDTSADVSSSHLSLTFHSFAGLFLITGIATSLATLLVSIRSCYLAKANSDAN
ncbi:hypothetical protein Fmac_013040 [Flemingia macrophylla]|uniref:Ionotropic glutamate receptor C-terminal domain-containing protein n=1 Tax=Flemingia macrophylla TaxID=520843 RepID=A0ABD1MS09_9FABA